jgi:hypothetical protein
MRWLRLGAGWGVVAGLRGRNRNKEPSVGRKALRHPIANECAEAQEADNRLRGHGGGLSRRKSERSTSKPPQHPDRIALLNCTEERLDPRALGMSGIHCPYSLASLGSGVMEVGAEKCIAKLFSRTRIPVFRLEVREDCAPLGGGVVVPSREQWVNQENMLDSYLVQHAGDTLTDVVRRTSDTDEGDPIASQLGGDSCSCPVRRIVQIILGDEHRHGPRRTSVNLQERLTG